MPTLEQVVEFKERLHRDSTALIQSKGHDYSRKQQGTGDTLFNLRVAEILGIVPTAEQGILVRLSDKLMRLISLMSPGVTAQVKNESLRDTVMDIYNYAAYALLLWEERQRAGQEAEAGQQLINAKRPPAEDIALLKKLQEEWRKEQADALKKPSRLDPRSVFVGGPKVETRVQTTPAYDVASEADEVAEVGPGQYQTTTPMKGKG